MAFHIQGTIKFPNCYFPRSYLILEHPLGSRKALGMFQTVLFLVLPVANQMVKFQIDCLATSVGDNVLTAQH